MEALKVTQLSKYFGGIQAVHEVSLSLKPGERVALIGPNGAGKTTLLNMIGGQSSPTEGRVVFFGKDITDLSPVKRTHLGIGRSFQIAALFNGLSVFKNVLLGIQGTRTSRYQMFRSSSSYTRYHAMAEELLRSMDLWDMKDEVVDYLAYGDQRKLEIILSMIMQPKLLLLDEPSCGLTTGESAEITGMIRNLDAGITVLMVAHDMDLVFGVAERIIVLHYGQIITEGTCDEISCDLKVKEIYMGNEDGSHTLVNQ